MARRGGSEFKGLEKALAQLRVAPEEVLKGAAQQLNKEAGAIMTEAKLPENVPVDEGPLRASGHVRPPEYPTTTSVSISLGFGGPAGAGNHGGAINSEDVGYAVHVHEDLTANHPSGGRAKYLEIPVTERAKSMPARFARRLTAWVRKVFAR